MIFSHINPLCAPTPPPILVGMNGREYNRQVSWLFFIAFRVLPVFKLPKTVVYIPNCSKLQLRDSVGLTPTSLLSNKESSFFITPTPQIFNYVFSIALTI